MDNNINMTQLKNESLFNQIGNMDTVLDPTKVLIEINKIKDHIKSRGISGTGKSAYEKKGSKDNLVSEEDFYEAIKDAKSELKSLFIPAVGVIVSGDSRPDGKFVTRVTSKYMFYTLDENDRIDSSIMFNTVMPGSDRNDVSFAAGKALSYQKRYFLTKLLDVPTAGLDPENPAQLKKELIESIEKSFADNPEQATSFKKAWKDKYMNDINLSSLKIKKLTEIQKGLDKNI